MSSVSSPPPTPSTASLPSSRLNVNSNAFVPTGRAKITLKSADGQEVKLENLTKPNTTPSSATTALPPQGSVYRQGSPGTPTRRPTSIRMETEDQRRKRLAEEEEKEREKTRAKAQAEEKVRLEKEEAERKVKEEEERKREEEEKEKERLRKEEEEKERLRKEEEQRLKEEEDRIRREAEEQERVRQEEEERKRKEEEAEKERIQLEKERLAAEERLRQEEAEKERIRLEGEASKAKAESVDTPESREDGELAQEGSAQVISVTKDEVKEKAKEALRINTATSSSAALRKRPNNLDLSNTNNKNIGGAPLSALATARNIDDIGTVQYPKGVMSPKPELNANVKDGKFRYDFLVHLSSSLEPSALSDMIVISSSSSWKFALRSQICFLLLMPLVWSRWIRPLWG
jgi:translation initiation factor 4G